jgi:hypothetical protein
MMLTVAMVWSDRLYVVQKDGPEQLDFLGFQAGVISGL